MDLQEIGLWWGGFANRVDLTEKLDKWQAVLNTVMNLFHKMQGIS